MAASKGIGVRVFVRLLTISVLTAGALAQSPLPFSPLESPVPDGAGLPLGFGDVNGDGSPDLIVFGVPYLYLNDGHGRYTAAVGSSGQLGPATLTLIADFNQDGRADLLTCLSGQTVGTAALWFGTAAGTLVAAPQVPQLGTAGALAAGDIDGDGDLDIVAATRTFVGGMINFLPGPTSVFLNDGSGVFTNAGSMGLPPIGAGAMDLVDLEPDGDLDLVMTVTGSGLVVALNIGGTFVAPPGYFGVVTLGARLFRANLTGDAYADYVLARIGTAPLLFAGSPNGFSPIAAPLPNAKSAAVFDLTGDGIPELVSSDDYAISVFSLTPAGAGTLLLKLDRPGGDLLAADQDGDGDSDLLLHSRVVYTTWFNDGAGGFHRQGSGFEPRLMLGGPVALDVTGDGAPELIGTVADSPGAKLAIGQNDGTGRFSWTMTAVAGAVLANATSLPVVADVDGDGLKDLVLVEGIAQSGSTWNVSVRVVANGGGGLWTAGPATAIAAAYRFDAAAGDLNGDGRDDVVVSDFTSGVRVLFGSPAGLVAPGTVVSATNLPKRIALCDLDGDLDLDIAIAGELSNAVRNQGGGVFVPYLNFPVVNSIFITAGDVDGDGDVDIDLDDEIWLNQGSVWALLGTLPPGPLFGGGGEARSFDFDQDGDVDTVLGSARAYVFESGGSVSTHSLAFPSGYGFSFGFKLSPADLDRDGDLDLVCTDTIDQPQNMPVPRYPAVLYNTARQLTQDSPARPGRPLVMGLHGAPGGVGFVYASGAPASIAMPPFGTLFIDPNGAVLLGSPAIPAAGTGVVSIPVPSSASAFLGTTFEFQGFVDTVAGPRLTNARHVTIVSF